MCAGVVTLGPGRVGAPVHRMHHGVSGKVLAGALDT